MPRLFQEAVREVRVRYAPRGSCGPFAIIVVDFEPAPTGATEFEFVNLVDEKDLPVEFAEAVADGIRRELSGEVEPYLTEPLPGSGPDALAVVAALMRAQWHEIDSNEYGFRRAGQIAVRAAVARLGV